jgi:hypothetical protein
VELRQARVQAAQAIEINPFAAELARISVWIGEIQWMLRQGFPVNRQPICSESTRADREKEYPRSRHCRPVAITSRSLY